MPTPRTVVVGAILGLAPAPRGQLSELAASREVEVVEKQFWPGPCRPAAEIEGVHFNEWPMCLSIRFPFRASPIISLKGELEPRYSMPSQVFCQPPVPLSFLGMKKARITDLAGWPRPGECPRPRYHSG